MDDVDIATEWHDRALAAWIAAARVPVPAGQPGLCRQCHDHSQRLVYGRCAPCRDRQRRPNRP
ncbi:MULTISPECIES: conjugal transfer protein TraR [unclassified Sphingomonas]|uniref:conjugal transfer protein TraR n=1 Tax=unclassified Sphingomonas TaxID=196159 RepID=UPI000B120B9B|nr:MULTISPECIES: conjugal transfer protein TraR [unclassified Sphingomonas]